MRPGLAYFVILASALAGLMGFASWVTLPLSFALAGLGSVPAIAVMKERLERIGAGRVWIAALAASWAHAFLACLGAYGLGWVVAWHFVTR